VQKTMPRILSIRDRCHSSRIAQSLPVPSVLVSGSLRYQTHCVSVVDFMFFCRTLVNSVSLSLLHSLLEDPGIIWNIC
jgi:hypothetical protein